MPITHWNTRLLIGISQIDEHHRHLFNLIKNFYDNCSNKDQYHEFNKLFDELIDYATYHFSAEEKWMRQHNYYGLVVHKNEHDILSRELVNLYKNYHDLNRHLLMEILVFLHDWQEHIMKSDAEFGKFIAENNIGTLRDIEF